MLQFDEKGHLLPYEIIELTLAEFEAFFVEGLEDRAHRRGLFQNYLRYLEALKAIVVPPFFQWVDGSFVGPKRNPNDFDVVTFLDFEAHKAKEYELLWLKAQARIDWKMDGGFAFTCQSHHPMFEKSTQTMQFWQRIFGLSREDKQNIRYPKGFIRINFIQ